MAVGAVGAIGFAATSSNNKPVGLILAFGAIFICGLYLMLAPLAHWWPWNEADDGGPYETWLYVLLGAYPAQAKGVVGLFQLRPDGEREGFVVASGRAYWIAPRVCVRGEWTTTKPAFFEPDGFEVFYTMRSPPHGQPWPLDRSDIHEGVISLRRRPEITPAVGVACYTGEVQDFRDWSDNHPSIYAEVVQLSWEELVTRIEHDGRGLFESLSKRLGSR